MSKKIALFLIVVLVASLVPALGAASAQDKVKITWWHIDTSDAQSATWQAIADAYMAQNPNVEIEITILENEAFKARLVTVMQAGDPPDIFRSWGGGVLWQYAEAGLVRNIAPELEGEWKDSFSAKAALELYGQDGEYYGVPYTWGAVGIFYNKVLFEQAGLDPEVPPATWTEFIAAVEALKASGVAPIAVGAADRWPAHFWWVYTAIREGGQDAFLKAYNREGAFTDDPFVKAGADIKQLVDLEPFSEGYLGMNYGDSQVQMLDQAAAMELMGQWAVGAYQGSDAAKAEVLVPQLGWFPFPVIEGGAGNANDVLGGGDGFSVGANAPDEAVDFLKFLTNVENQTALVTSPLNIIPTVGAAEVAITDPIALQIIQARNEAPYFQLYYDQFLPPAVATAVLDGVEGLFAGTLSPEDAAATIEDVAAMELAE
ncbi:MAG: extracellular solute-binding protein [Chloroflexi bacterium]|nr:extracellular solute-binding protein [Chloroflexota bacterium]